MSIPSRWPDFLLSQSEAVLTLAINRPAKHNAMTISMWQQLADVCDWIEHESTATALVVTGVGGSFCAGADISALAEDDAAMKVVVARAEGALRELTVPTIAMIRGNCIGGGNQIAIACDVRICDETARFGIPPARLGVVYGPSSTRDAIALIGPSAFKRLVFSADPIGASEALRIGLVDEVVEPDALDGAVQALLAQWGPRSLLTQAASKAIANRIVDGGDVDGVYEEWMSRWQGSPDSAEGPAAFLGKRPAQFTWRPSR